MGPARSAQTPAQTLEGKGNSQVGGADRKNEKIHSGLRHSDFDLSQGKKCLLAPRCCLQEPEVSPRNEQLFLSPLPR